MHHLVVPDELPGGCNQRHQTIAKEILPLAVCAVEIVGGRADGKEYEIAFHIDAHHRPDVCSRTPLPRVTFPSFMSDFSRLRNGVKGPDKFSGVDVERPDHSAWTDGGILGNFGPCDHEISIHGGRRCNCVKLIGAALLNTYAQINHAVISKAGAELAGRGIQGDQTSVKGAKQNPAVVASSILPICYAPVLVKLAWAGAASLWVKLPNFATALGIKSDNTV